MHLAQKNFFISIRVGIILSTFIFSNDMNSKDIKYCSRTVVIQSNDKHCSLKIHGYGIYTNNVLSLCIHIPYVYYRQCRKKMFILCINNILKRPYDNQTNVMKWKLVMTRVDRSCDPWILFGRTVFVWKLVYGRILTSRSNITSTSFASLSLIFLVIFKFL